MANLHKTEKKLPWLVRDGGLASDWLGGRIGGILCSHTVKLVWHARQRRNTRIYTHTYIPFPQERRSAFSRQRKTSYQIGICIEVPTCLWVDLLGNTKYLTDRENPINPIGELDLS